MPSNYISLMNPPAPLVESYRQKAAEHGLGLERFMSMVVKYACEHKPSFDGGVSLDAREERFLGNLNIPADGTRKRCLADWGRAFGRKPNEQLVFALRKFLTLDVPFDDLRLGFAEEPDPKFLARNMRAIKIGDGRKASRQVSRKTARKSKKRRATAPRT